MVKITNIEKIGNKISMDCFEEGFQDRAHHVEFDAETLEVTNDVNVNIYIRQSIAKLWKLLREGNELPSEAISYWC